MKEESKEEEESSEESEEESKDEEKKKTKLLLPRDKRNPNQKLQSKKILYIRQVIERVIN
uniref:hypothetical protein n=1 Tax=Algoriphagus sp. TaxID=1872435 RepID=UPI0040475795